MCREHAELVKRAENMQNLQDKATHGVSSPPIKTFGHPGQNLLALHNCWLSPYPIRKRLCCPMKVLVKIILTNEKRSARFLHVFCMFCMK